MACFAPNLARQSYQIDFIAIFVCRLQIVKSKSRYHAGRESKQHCPCPPQTIALDALWQRVASQESKPDVHVKLLAAPSSKHAMPTGGNYRITYNL